MTGTQQRPISAQANFLRQQEVKRSGRSQNSVLMRGGKV
ncbi:hypothetical protein OJJOAM_002256 [Cupriavidus sp. H18C1]